MPPAPNRTTTTPNASTQRGQMANGLKKGWKRFPAKIFLKEIDQRSKAGDEELLGLSKARGVLRKSDFDQRSSEAETYAGYKKVNTGDLVSNKMQAWNGMFGISPFDGITSPDYAIFRFKGAVEARLLEYTFRTDLYAGEFKCRSRGMGTGFLRLHPGDLLSTPVWLPDLATQKAIADFLDRETARINQLIEKKQRLVELLEEKRMAETEALLASDCATANARLKIGIRKIEQGWSPLCDDRQVEGDDWAVLKLGAITGAQFNELSHKALPEGVEPRQEYRVRAGDVLIARASGSPKLVGRACFIETVSRNLLLSDKHYRVHFEREMFHPRYFVFLVNSRRCRAQIEAQLSSAEGMARNIGQDVIRNLRAPLPVYHAQEQITEAIVAATRLISATSAKVTASIERLREYRSALITAAVTGQIAVSSRKEAGRRAADAALVAEA